MTRPNHQTRTVEVACQGKAGFESRTLADTVAGRVMRRGGRSDVYKCPFCGMWHVGEALRNRRAKQQQVKRQYR